MIRTIGIATLIVGIVSFARAEIVQPPAPTGPHGVGTESRRLVDEKRLEAFTDAPDDHRELMVQFWYPADGTAGKATTAYMPANPEVRKLMFGQLGISPARVDELLVPWRTHSVEKAALSKAKERYPVVLFSHGFGGFRTQNLSQMEELASRGYIVVAIEHTFCAAAVEFPDGRVVQFAPEFKKMDPKGDRNVMDKRFDELARLWGADASFVIDELEKLNGASGDAFAGRLDLDKIGMFGHSFGGATSAQMCLRDPRVKCGINMDGRSYGDPRTEGVTRPIMILCVAREKADPAMLALTGMTPESYKALVDAMMQEFDRVVHSAPEGYLVTIHKMEHYNFTDFPFISELSPVRKSVVGEIEAARGGKIISDYVLAFFGKYLLGEPAPSLSASAAHEPEVTFEVYERK